MKRHELRHVTLDRGAQLCVVSSRRLVVRAASVPSRKYGQSNTVVARELRLTKQTIGKWRTRFLSQRLDGLLDELRPGAPPSASAMPRWSG